MNHLSKGFCSHLVYWISLIFLRNLWQIIFPRNDLFPLVFKYISLKLYKIFFYIFNISYSYVYISFIISTILFFSLLVFLISGFSGVYILSLTFLRSFGFFNYYFKNTLGKFQLVLIITSELLSLFIFVIVC